MKNRFLGKLIKAFADREVDDFPPEVSDNTLYSYSNFRGAEVSSCGPRDEAVKKNERDAEVYVVRGTPQIEYCRQ
jgi:hypothetical protein